MPFTRLTDESGNVLLDESGNVLGDESYTDTVSLTADTGIISITGNDASVLANRKITGDTGTVTIAGHDATVIKVKVLVGETGVIDINGINADFNVPSAPVFNSNLVTFVAQENRTVTVFEEVRPTLAVPYENRTVHVEYNPTRRNL